MLVFNKNVVDRTVGVIRKKTYSFKHGASRKIPCNAGYMEIRCKVCSCGNNMHIDPDSAEDFFFGVVDASYAQEKFPRELLDAVYDSVRHHQVRLVAGVFGMAEDQISELMDKLSPSHT